MREALSLTASSGGYVYVLFSHSTVYIGSIFVHFSAQVPKMAPCSMATYKPMRKYLGSVWFLLFVFAATEERSYAMESVIITCAAPAANLADVVADRERRCLGTVVRPDRARRRHRPPPQHRHQGRACVSVWSLPTFLASLSSRLSNAGKQVECGLQGHCLRCTV